MTNLFVLRDFKQSKHFRTKIIEENNGIFAAVWCSRFCIYLVIFASVHFFFSCVFEACLYFLVLHTTLCFVKLLLALYDFLHILLVYDERFWNKFGYLVGFFPLVCTLSQQTGFLPRFLFFFTNHHKSSDHRIHQCDQSV